MATMVRKQIYIEQRQETQLKRLARQRKVTEAEIIREALDRQLEAPTRSLPPDPAAWARALKFMKQLSTARRKPQTFRREELYEDRLRRWR